MKGRNLLLTMIQLISMALLLAACGAPAASPTPPKLTGGVLATLEVVGHQFHAWVTNPQTMQQILDLQQGASRANIPNGRILWGPGQGEHNAPWSWHLDPEDIEMAEMAVEACDGTPSFVEDEVDYFVDTVGRY